MMKKKIISIIVLAIFLIAAFIYLNRVFASEHHYVNTTEDFKNLAKKTNIDVIFYGSSHSYTAFNPLIIDSICKTISYNLGSDALKIELTDLVLNESLKYTKPKLIILEVYPPSLLPVGGDQDKGYQLRAMDFVSNFSFLKLKKTVEIYNPNEYLGVYFPLIRNHSKWNEFNYFNLNKRKDLDYKKNFFFNGFLGSLNTMNEKDQQTFANFKTHPIKNETSNSWLKEEAKEKIKDFVNMAKKSGAEVLIISSPDPRARVFFNYYFYEEMNDFATSMNVKFLNLNDYYNEMQLDIKDFKDNSHLNTYGSIKATKFLSDYLNNNYNLPNRSSEPVWKDEIYKYEDFKYDFFEFEKKSFYTRIDKELLKNIFVKSVSVTRNNKRELLFNITFDMNKTNFKILDNYKLAIHIYPFVNDKSSLSEASKLKNSSYDQFNVNIENEDGSNNIYLGTKIKRIEKIELFLFRKSGYNGVLGERIIIKNMSFKKVTDGK